eukprot:11186401-Lingulodinium_polyedra.AAC.1
MAARGRSSERYAFPEYLANLIGAGCCDVRLFAGAVLILRNCPRSKTAQTLRLLGRPAAASSTVWLIVWFHLKSVETNAP